MPSIKIVGSIEDIDKLDLVLGEPWDYPDDFYPEELDPETATPEQTEAYVVELDKKVALADEIAEEVQKRFAAKKDAAMAQPETKSGDCKDLEFLKGIGSVWEQRLYDAGIGDPNDLAAADPVQLTKVLSGMGRINVEKVRGWIAEAQAYTTKNTKA